MRHWKLDRRRDRRRPARGRRGRGPRAEQSRRDCGRRCPARPRDIGSVQGRHADNVFEPTTASVAAGTPVEIEIQNSGPASHNFTSEALNVSTGPMQAGDEKTVSVTVPSGRTQFICTWHQGMVIASDVGTA
jgi:plastocyanin